MNERNSVAVKIYGQEYSINGELPREKILQLADYVDGKMREVGEFYNGPVSSVAVLAGMNLAEELFARGDQSKEIEALRKSLEDTERFNEVLRNRVEELNAKLEESKSVPEESQKLIAELEAKSRDIESSFFDLQMENIHLKNEIENLRKQQNYR